MPRLTAWAPYIGALGVALIAAGVLLSLIGTLPANFLLGFVAVGAILIAFYFLTRPRQAEREKAAARVALNGTNLIVLALAFIGIVAAINFIVDKQFSQRIDVTASHSHTLSDQTIKVLQQLDAPVKVTGFFTPETDAQRIEAENALKDYTQKTDKLLVTWIDPDENPAAAQAYDNVIAGTIIFEKDGAPGTKPRTEKIYSPFDESTLTNAILKVTQTEQPVVYFTTGHDEIDLNTAQDNGFTDIAEFLKQTNYKVEPLNLASITGTLPADTSAIVIAGPREKFAAQDVKLIEDYMSKGGRALVMIDPNSDAGLNDLLKSWGVTLDNNLVLDPELNYRGNPPAPFMRTFPDSKVTQDLEAFGVFLPGARSVQIDGTDGNQNTPILSTTEAACAKTDFEALKNQQEIQCDPAKDGKGPFVLGYAIEGQTAAGAKQAPRLIVIGNATFPLNYWVAQQDGLGNKLLFANAINWLAGQEDLIAIPPRDQDVRALDSLSGNDLNLVFWTSVLFIPLAALLVGGLMWWRRR